VAAAAAATGAAAPRPGGKKEIGRIVGNAGNCCLAVILAPIFILLIGILIGLLVDALRAGRPHP
jgi:hypothetical protein